MKKTDMLQDKKEDQISIRCTPQEKALIHKYSEETGLSMNKYILQMCVISQSYTSPINYVTIISKMQSLTNLFKIQSISRKDYVKNMEREMRKLWP